MKVPLFVDNSEYVLNGHPDRICDGIAETIAMAIWNLDGWGGRSACELLYSGNTLVVGGEFKTSLNKENFTSIINWIAKKIIAKQTSSVPEIKHIWQKQSDEIFQASLSGLGDNTIAYGYYDKETNSNITSKHKKLRDLGNKITQKHNKELPDGKLIMINGYETISIEKGISEKELQLINSKIKQPKIFIKSGAMADAGVVGRKLIAERHGNGIPHGGGAFNGKDFTKGDKSLKLIGDFIAQKEGILNKETTLIQLSCEYGGNKIWVNNITTQKNKEYFFTEILKNHSISKMYNMFAPTKPSHFLKKTELDELERILLKFSNKTELKNQLW